MGQEVSPALKTSIPDRLYSPKAVGDVSAAPTPAQVVMSIAEQRDLGEPHVKPESPCSLLKLNLHMGPVRGASGKVAACLRAFLRILET